MNAFEERPDKAEVGGRSAFEPIDVEPRLRPIGENDSFVLILPFAEQFDDLR
jgi:hypothetical protein